MFFILWSRRKTSEDMWGCRRITVRPVDSKARSRTEEFNFLFPSVQLRCIFHFSVDVFLEEFLGTFQDFVLGVYVYGLVGLKLRSVIIV